LPPTFAEVFHVFPGSSPLCTRHGTFIRFDSHHSDLFFPPHCYHRGRFHHCCVPDPQNYSQYYPQIFDAQTQWIAANSAAQNVQVVLEVGDSVNNSKDLAEWQNANHSISLLDQSGVPYAIAGGNHDYDTLPPTNRPATYFNQYFGPSRYSGKPYYGSSNFPPGSNENFYETFTWGGKPYLILVLEFVPRSSAVARAKSVLSANTDKEVIVCHAQLSLFRCYDRRSMRYGRHGRR